MIIGYGYQRRESELRKLGAEKVYLDHSPERPDRADLLKSTATARDGDVLVLVHYADLGGHFTERNRARRLLAERGVLVQVGDNEPVLYDTDQKRRDFKLQKGGRQTQKHKGAPRKWTPTDEQLWEFAAFWHASDIYTLAHCRRKYAEIFGEDWGDLTLGRVRHRMGGRETPKSPFDEPRTTPDAPLDGDE